MTIVVMVPALGLHKWSEAAKAVTGIGVPYCVHTALRLEPVSMKMRKLIGTAKIPGGDELRLFQRGDDFMIVLDRNELMSSRMSGSEEALADLTCDQLRHVSAPHLLIGGYGMGFTLRAALARLPVEARLTVAELVPEIIDWARGPMSALAKGCLDDPRVTLILSDVAGVIAEGVGRFDAILLDVDNGPDGLVRAANNRIYSAMGLAAAKAALRPNGVLAIWSAAPDAAFTLRLKEAGFAVDEVVVRARSNGKGPRHVIWFARKT
jgi:spermidine synthase